MIYAGSSATDTLQINDYIIEEDDKTSISHVGPNGELSKIFYKRKIQGRNNRQHCLLDAISRPNIRIINLFGPARVGKTFLTFGTAVEDLLAGHIEKVIVVRDQPPATRYPLGFLPGEAATKLAPRFQAITDTMESLVRHTKIFKRDPKSELEDLMRHDRVEFVTLEFLRGRNLENTVIICDDAQALNVDGLRLLITRLSDGSRLILQGDISQIDDERNRDPGMLYLDTVMSGDPMYCRLDFTEADLPDGVVGQFLRREAALQK